MARKGIYKRGGTWWIRYAGLDGRIIRKSTGSAKFSDAELMLHTEKKAVREGIQPETKIIQNYTFKDLAEKYKDWVKGRQASAAVKIYNIDRLLDRYDSVPLRRFNTVLLEQLQTDLMTRGLRSEKAKGGKGKNIRGLKPTSINRILSTIKHMFSKAVDWEMVEAELLKKLRRVKQFKEQSRLRYLTAEEARGLVSVCDEHLRPIVITALLTGMRRGEILNLRWDHLDMRHDFILLDKTKNGERREIPINATLKTLFQKLPRRIDCPYVFHDPKTLKPYGEVKHSFSTAVNRAGIKDFHFHDLRHTYASLAIMSGEIDITTLKTLLGHKDIKMTLRYAHLAPAHNRKAARVMDTVMSLPESSLQPTAQLLHKETKKESAVIANSLDCLVELRGIEPLTPRLPALCSPS